MQSWNRRMFGVAAALCAWGVALSQGVSARAQDAPAKPAERLVLPPSAPARPANQPAPLLPGRLQAPGVSEPVRIEPTKADAKGGEGRQEQAKAAGKEAEARAAEAKATAQKAAQAELRARAALQIRGAIVNAIAEEGRAASATQGTALSTSEDLERLLEKAVQVAADRPDLAPVLWQRILDEGASTFARASVRNAIPLRRTYEIFRPFSNESLQAIINAGPEALRQYRLFSDGPARGLFATQEPARVQALSEIVRRYFLTSVGDDAAFELGCRQLERGDFTSADQQFEKLSLYPDSNIDPNEILIRRIVAQSHLGRTDTALGMLEKLTGSASDIQSQLAAEISARQSSSHAGAGDVPLPQTPRKVSNGGPLEPEWEFRPAWTLKGVKSTANNQAIMSGTMNGRPMIFVRQSGGNYVQTTLDDKNIPDLGMAQLASNWKAAAWRPASQPMLVEGRLYLKSESRTVCCDAATGKVLWMGRPTRFPIDDWSRQMAIVAAHGVNVSYPSNTYIAGIQPKTLTEIMLFSDRLHHGIAVAGGRVFAIEGALDTPATRNASQPEPERAMGFAGTAQRQQPRHNELACYDAASGRLKWVVGRKTVFEEGTSLWSAPLVVGDLVIVATGTDSQLGVAALKAADGSLVWKSNLADVSRMPPTIPVGLNVDDGSIYVASGAGTLFSIDRNGGNLRWAVTYPRIRSNTSTDRRAALMVDGSGGPKTQVVLEENFVRREGGAVIVAACDSDHVMAFDVTDGSLRWDSPLPPPLLNGNPGYVVGVGEGRIVLASSRWLWGINTRGGRIAWDLPLEASCGRGMLAAGAVLVPQGRTILNVNATTGKILKSVDVDTPDSEPVGNLLSDGTQVLVASAARLLAMKPRQADPPPARPASEEGARP